jgi:nitrite reductase/ring-hydroxylating ferredoxin subunit
VRIAVCALEELAPGVPRAVSAGRRSLVLVRTPDGEIHALNNRCPHRGAKLSFGPVLQKVTASGRDYELVAGEYVIRCPWHSYEFDLPTGQCLVDPTNVRVRTYPVEVADGQVYVTVGPARGRARQVTA